METQPESKANASQEFNRTNVESNETIRLVDTDEATGLDLFCYSNCKDNDSDLVKQCRGVVFHGDQIVMKSFPYTPEYNHTQDFSDLFKEDFEKWSFYDAYEGTVLRMFFFAGKWFLSTHRKLNAFRSKWSCKDSFGTLFKQSLDAECQDDPTFASRLGNGENILEKFQSTLDTTKQYMFLLCNNNENRIVCIAPPMSKSYHIGTFLQDGTLDMDWKCLLPQPRRLTFSSPDEIGVYIGREVNPEFFPGLICLGPNNQQVKIVHKDYQDMFRVRGNEPSIKFRYLQVRMDKRMVSLLYSLYPDMVETFEDYENCLYCVAKYIYESYVKRFIRKPKNQFVTVPKEEFQVIKACHNFYLTDPSNNRITLEKVITVLNKQPPTNLNRMIRRYKTNQVNLSNSNPRDYQNSPAFVGLSPGINPKMTPLILKSKLNLDKN